MIRSQVLFFILLCDNVTSFDDVIRSEASLRMVAPGAGFRGGTLYRPKNR